ncbi:MAG: glycosyltransferase family 2 protein [Rhodocyclaceae bacterium]|nr:glycosyltransferase family 2 protein [Rhodocyclaceae bacterium]
MMRPNSTCPRVAVIIPFFQRTRGLLADGVRSILAQTGVEGLEVIVVDDGSPIPAEQELQELLEASSGRIRIVKQPNSGPGAARNRGLDSVGPATEYVAFLDSDDRWEPTFLGDAVFALDQGYDVFFGNTTRFSLDGTRFSWSASPDLNLRVENHVPIDSAREVYSFQGDFFDFLVFRSSIISTSTLVFNFRKHSNLRFEEKLFNGQDRLFKLALGKGSTKAAFSPKVCAVEGEGVNIFDSSGWGSEKSIRLVANYIRLSKFILDRIEMNQAQQRHIHAQLDESRRAFAASMLHLLKNRVRIDVGIVRAAFRSDPATALLLLPNMGRIVIDKILPRRSGDATRDH